MRIFRPLVIIFVAIFSLLSFSSCGDGDDPVVPKERTLFMFFPWTGDLTSYFKRNIEDMEQAIQSHGLKDQRVIVYFADSPTSAELFEIAWQNETAVRRPLKTYETLNTKSPEAIAALLSDIKTIAPARQYSMTIGCHGFGWVESKNSSYVAAQRARRPQGEYHITRYFGGSTPQYQIDIDTFRQAIETAGMHFDYILFDDCYMASIEVAYELRNTTDVIIASTCEMMGPGLPYKTVGPHLLGTPDYKAACDEFFKFYSSYTVPCGTLSVINCLEVSNMAQLMKDLNSQTTDLSAQELPSVQKFDGFYPVIFFDMESYVKTRCRSNTALYNAFARQLQSTVIYEVHTPQYYSASSGYEDLNTSSGVSISDPSVNNIAAGKKETSWWKATH